jgi:hypothetical protein
MTIMLNRPPLEVTWSPDVEPPPIPVQAPPITYTLTVTGGEGLCMTWSADDLEARARVESAFTFFRQLGYWAYTDEGRNSTVIQAHEPLPETDVQMHPQHVGG